ncbi:MULTISPECIES: helix-turn-helix transcriptional regulator [unclassified Nocardiopsis]|uniref:helix-turn-helix domain-containing protein n=1 Tax=unclassified Nocardiopsis TaxID=2649073 RepID=UPI000A533812|nr:helix-turn-helix transcriptional regulator [Nocardiopsis sp. TSRI0078]
MGQSPAGVTRRTIARVMKRARIRAGIKSGTAARHADISPGTLTKYEKAENPWPVPVVYVLSEFYGLSQEDRDKLVDLARQKELGWWHRHRDIPEWFESYVGLESEAHTVLNYEDGTIPGLLQTADYARAVLSADVDADSDEQVEAHVTVRMQRQKRLTEDPPLQFNAVVNESALYRTIGSAKIMSEQLSFLVERAELPNVDLRVLPFESGAHAASEGSFVLMQFPDLLADVSFGDVVLVEYRAGALYLEKDPDIDLFSRIFQRVQHQAWNPEESVKRIQSVRSERYEG